jgi:hypothetical protein
VYHTDYYTDFGKLNEISVVISPGPSYLESSATLYGDAYLSNGSLVLDGTGDYAVIDDGFRFTDSMTTSVWFKTTATGDRRIYSSHVRQMGGAHFSNGFFARLNNGQLKYRHPAGGTRELTGPSGLNDGAWHHLALSWEAGVGYVLYVDGVQRGQGSSGASDGYAAGWGLYIGANPWNNKDPYALFDGEIKNFEVLNEVLTSQQVTDRINDRFFEENLDQWLGDGSSEENCFEWNIQVSRHDLLSTPLSLSRARARSLTRAGVLSHRLTRSSSHVVYSSSSSSSSSPLRLLHHHHLLLLLLLLFSGRAATAVHHPTRTVRSSTTVRTAALAAPKLAVRCASTASSRALAAFRSASATISWYHRA